MTPDEKLFECLMSEKKYADERIAVYTEANQKIMTLVVTVVAAILSYSFAPEKSVQPAPQTIVKPNPQAPPQQSIVVTVSVDGHPTTFAASPSPAQTAAQAASPVIAQPDRTAGTFGGQTFPNALLISSVLLSLAILQGNYYSGLCFLYIERKDRFLGELMRGEIGLAINPMSPSPRFSHSPIFRPYFWSVESYFIFTALAGVALALAGKSLGDMIPHGSAHYVFSWGTLTLAGITMVLTYWLVGVRWWKWHQAKGSGQYEAEEAVIKQMKTSPDAIYLRSPHTDDTDGQIPQ